MSEQNKTTVRRFIEAVWCNGDTNYINEVCSPNVTCHTPTPGTPPNRDGITNFCTQWNNAFNNTNLNITNQWTDNNTVCTYWTATTNHNGPWWNTPPTNNDCNISGVTICRFDDNGNITEVWEQCDWYTLMQNIDAVPNPTPTPTP